MPVKRDINTGAVSQTPAAPPRPPEVSVRDVTPRGARGPYRIFPGLKFSGCGHPDLRCDLLLCELGDGRALVVARMLTPLPSDQDQGLARALANKVFIEFGVGQERQRLAFERGRTGADARLAFALLRNHPMADCSCHGFHFPSSNDLRRDRIPTPAEWPPQWTAGRHAATPGGVAAVALLPDTSPFTDLTLGIPFGEAAEPPPAAAARERGPEYLAGARPGGEASLGDLVAALVRDAADGDPARGGPVPRALDLEWARVVLLQPCPRAGWWQIHGRISPAAAVGKVLADPIPLAISSDLDELTRELGHRGYELVEGWIRRSDRRGLEIWAHEEVLA